MRYGPCTVHCTEHMSLCATPGWEHARDVWNSLTWRSLPPFLPYLAVAVEQVECL
jgi:hypothetical protein